MPYTVSLADIDKFIRASINALLEYRSIKTAPNFHWKKLFSQNTELDASLTTEIEPGGYLDLINALSQPRFAAIATNSKRFLGALTTIVKQAVELFHLHHDHKQYVELFLATPNVSTSSLFGRGDLRIEQTDAAINALLDIYDTTDLGEIDPSIHHVCTAAQTTMNEHRETDPPHISDAEKSLMAITGVF